MLKALLDEYWKVLHEFLPILVEIRQEDYVAIKDEKTEDPDCRSIQSIVEHMVRAGYTYANYVNQGNGIEWYEYKPSISNPQHGKQELEQMMAFTEKSFEAIWYKTHKEIGEFSYDSRWGTTYNFEQLLEHAIVHISRHRRQIVNFLQ